MSLHQDFGQLCNRGTRNSDFLSHPSDFAVSPWKEESGTAPGRHADGNLPLGRKASQMSLLSSLHTFTCHPRSCRPHSVCKHWEDQDNRLPKILAPGSAPTPWPQASNSHLCAFTPARKKGAIMNSQGCDALEREKSSVFERHLHPSYLCPRTCHAGAVLIRV